MSQVEAIKNNAYRVRHRKVDAEIGDSSKKGFYPHIKLKRWDGERNFTLGYPRVSVKHPKIENERIKWEIGGWGFHYYAVEARIVQTVVRGELHEFVQNEEGGLEYEILLKRTPTSFGYTFSIPIEGLRYLWQGPLHPDHPTWEENEKGEVIAIRPENVVNSIAVYADDVPNWYSNHAEAEKKKVGKLWHIYRPELTDANGVKTWGEWELDLPNGRLILYLPREWLEDPIRAYPVIVGPNFGYETIGGSNINIAGHLRGTVYTCGGSGTADSITAALKKAGPSGSFHDKCALYETNGDLVTNGGGPDEYNALTSTYQWITFEYTGTKPSVAAQDYVVIVWGKGPSSHYIAYDAESGIGRDDAETYNGWPDPASFTVTATKCSIYCTYTAGGAPIEKTYSVDTLFKKLGIQKTMGVDVRIRKEDIQKTMGVDVRIRKPDILKTLGVDSFFQTVGNEKTVNVDTLFKKLNIEKAVGVDVWLGGVTTYEKAVALDALFRKLSIEKTLGLDSLFLKTVELSTGVDALFLTEIQKQVLVDSLFRAIIEKAIGVDSLLSLSDIGRAFGVDVYIGDYIGWPGIHGTATLRRKGGTATLRRKGGTATLRRKEGEVRLR